MKCVFQQEAIATSQVTNLYTGSKQNCKLFAGKYIKYGKSYTKLSVGGTLLRLAKIIGICAVCLPPLAIPFICCRTLRDRVKVWVKEVRQQKEKTIHYIPLIVKETLKQNEKATPDHTSPLISSEKPKTSPPEILTQTENTTLDCTRKSKNVLPEVSQHPSLEEVVQGQVKVLPVLEKDAQDITCAIQRFKNHALDVLQKAQLVQPLLNFNLTQEQQKKLQEANHGRRDQELPAGLKVMRGGKQTVLFLEDIPGFVFKPIGDVFDYDSAEHKQQEAEAYVKTTERARQTITDHNLYLLHAPESKVIEINNVYFIMQEKADLIAGSYQDQKGIYSFCWKDEQMREYMKTLFSQLIIFICETNFADVKYDNIPLTGDGKVALIDLDQSSCIAGLTTSGAFKQTDGLFNYIPDEYISDFLEIAKKQMKQELHAPLIQSIEKIKVKAQKKKNKARDYAQFVQRNSISYSSQIN